VMVTEVVVLSFHYSPIRMLLLPLFRMSGCLVLILDASVKIIIQDKKLYLILVTYNKVRNNDY
jgi:hypothetical protein